MKASWVIAVLIAFYFAGCKSENATISTVAPPSSSTGTVTHVSASGGAPFVHTQTMSQKADLYFIYTNGTSSSVSGTFSATAANQAPPKADLAPFDPAQIPQASLQGQDMGTWARQRGIGLRGTPEASQFNHRVQELSARYQASLTPKEPNFAALGDTHTFNGVFSGETPASTLRSVTTDGTVTVNLWVADDSWGTCSKKHCVTQTMVDALATKFIQTGSNNDIYDWVTNLYGTPWGSHSSSVLIPASNANSIDILLYDIQSDNSDNGGYLGVFYSRDNYLSTVVSSSNERLVFYIDSVMTATPTGTTWEVTDEWPGEMVSTLAHEFQHMIHFYQKNVLLSVVSSNTDSWIEEMMSMMTEDLLSDKMLVNGPRGVAYNDGTAGTSTDSSSRPAWFNYYPYLGQAYWANDNAVLYRYAINYVFGAYLLRNYGGAALAKALMTTSGDNQNTVVNALGSLGYTVSYSELIQRFQAAVLLSSQTNAPTNYQLNQGSYFTSTLNGVDYNAGSINLFGYGTGPKIFTSGLTSLDTTGGAIYKVGSSLSGTQSFTVEMPTGASLTVVEKP
ncbi:MAG: hypothetical protein RRB13_00990 [bacterium]|nr:hypothetical protein [bacterium]